MKTIAKGTELRRVSDDDADKLVKEGWHYCPKHVWKKAKKEAKS